MSKINAKKINEIKKSIKNNKVSIEDVKLMINIIEEIRKDVHSAEDAGDALLGIAEDLGTNCYPDKDIDYCKDD